MQAFGTRRAQLSRTIRASGGPVALKKDTISNLFRYTAQKKPVSGIRLDGFDRVPGVDVAGRRLDGDDWLSGFEGNDALDGGEGRDRCAGGPGIDAVTNCEAGT